MTAYEDHFQAFSINEKDVTFENEIAIQLDEQNHKKLEAALRKEPYNCTVFNEKEMVIVKRVFEHVSSVIQAYRSIPPKHRFECLEYAIPKEMTREEWYRFLEKF